MMTVHPEKSDPNCNHSHMTCRACVELPLDVNEIDYRIDTRISNPLHILLLHLVALENGRKPDIGTLKKERGDIFS